MDDIDEIRRRIYNAKLEMRTAGWTHKRDLKKYVRRLESELKSRQMLKRKKVMP